jgi:two-component system, NtrC family, sensor kinase
MKPACILYVEDDQNDVFLLRYMLKANALPVEIVHVSTPEEFSTAIEQRKPDLILADSNVPGFDTNAALVMARERCPTTPFFYLTGFTTEQRTAACRAAGAHGCLLKNDRNAVSAAIRGALGNRVDVQGQRGDAAEETPSRG